MKTWLLDTGPIVAYLDTDDPFHLSVAEAINAFSGEFVTTNAVIVESMYFISRLDGDPEVLVNFFEESRTQIFDFCQPDELRLAARLMKKYADTPMDLADATLILLADVVKQNSICTLDRRGFSAYRTLEGKRFNQVLSL